MVLLFYAQFFVNQSNFFAGRSLPEVVGGYFSVGFVKFFQEVAIIFSHSDVFSPLNSPKSRGMVMIAPINNFRLFMFRKRRFRVSGIF